MRIKYGGYKLRGYYKMADLALKYLNMTKPAKTKLDILTFFNKHGLSATKDAYSISRSSLYRWKLLYRNYGINGLEEKRTCPHNTRKRHWDYRIVAEIESIRVAHPRLGARKIIRRMRRLCLSYDIACPSISTITRIISDNKAIMASSNLKDIKAARRRRRGSSRPIQRRPAGWRAQSCGDCLAIDSIVFYIDGKKRYITTCIDHYSRFAFAYASNSISSKNASEFFERVLRVFPLQVSNVLSDNGSEFMKHFREMVDKKKITHWKIYPKRPQMNAICERFNRTIQEEFVNYNTQDLINPKIFNQKLSNWLYWYNCERDHHSLGYNTPMEFMKKDFESQVIWGHTWQQIIDNLY